MSVDQLLSFTSTGGTNFTASFDAFGALGAFGGGGGGGGGTTGFSLTTFVTSILSASTGGGGGGGGGVIISTGGVGGGGGGVCFELFCAISCDVAKHTASTRTIFFILVIFSALMQASKLSIIFFHRVSQRGIKKLPIYQQGVLNFLFT